MPANVNSCGIEEHLKNQGILESYFIVQKDKRIGHKLYNLDSILPWNQGICTCIIMLKLFRTYYYTNLYQRIQYHTKSKEIFSSSKICLQ